MIILPRPPTPGCPRAHESHSAQFAGVGATWPGHEAGNLPLLCVSHASDHLIGIAALLDADNVVMACLSLVRPTLESLATAYYLLEPECDERERVRRWANMQLTSYVERLNINSSDMAASRQLQQLLDAGQQQGWVPGRAKRTRAGRTASAWLDQPPRSAQALVGDLLDELGPGAGALLHRASSGVLHGQVHGMHLLLRGNDAPTADDPRDVLIAAGLSVLDVLTWTAPLLWGISRACWSERTPTTAGHLACSSAICCVPKHSGSPGCVRAKPRALSSQAVPNEDDKRRFNSRPSTAPSSAPPNDTSSADEAGAPAR